MAERLQETERKLRDTEAVIQELREKNEFLKIEKNEEDAAQQKEKLIACQAEAERQAEADRQEADRRAQAAKERLEALLAKAEAERENEAAKGHDQQDDHADCGKKRGLHRVAKSNGQQLPAQDP